MFLIVFFSLILFFQEEVPLKSKTDFEVKFEMSFKQRQASDESLTVRYDETASDREKRTNLDPLPYLTLRVKILKLQDGEIRMKVIKDNKSTVMNKKTATNQEVSLEVGFVADAKDQISGYKHVVQFLSSDKKTVSQIIIEFDKEGNYLVNGEKRGKV
jgi:hypothetical protein